MVSNDSTTKVESEARVDPEKSAMGGDDMSYRAASATMTSPDIIENVVDPALASRTLLVNEV